VCSLRALHERSPAASGQAFAQTTQTETKYVTVEGEVVRYEAGRVIVIRGTDNKETTYTPLA